jgi:hypothetical protein
MSTGSCAMPCWTGCLLLGEIASSLPDKLRDRGAVSDARNG